MLQCFSTMTMQSMQNTTKDKYDEEYRVYSLTITLEEKYVFFPLE
jgi:hypothetical protein